MEKNPGTLLAGVRRGSARTCKCLPWPQCPTVAVTTAVQRTQDLLHELHREYGFHQLLLKTGQQRQLWCCGFGLGALMIGLGGEAKRSEHTRARRNPG